jgi:TetR/AcrR family transcriptional repressor of nem operon
VARPREFDPDVAVRDAMDLFWDRGYHATSVADLCAGTGLKPGSLYAAFGDKQRLFLAALDRYTADGLALMDAMLAGGPSPRAAVRAWLLHFAAASAGDAGARGCLVTGSAMELVPHDPEVAARIARMFRAMEDRLTAAVARARAAGEVASGRTDRALARFLLCTLEGMRVLGKTRPSAAATRTLVDTALDALGPSI